MKDKESYHLDERRKFSRLNRRDLVRLSEVNLFDELDLSDTHERSIDARLLNISAGGALVESNYPYDEETYLKMELHIPDWVKYDYTCLDSDNRFPCKPLIAVGKIIRRETIKPSLWHFGIFFIAIDEKHRKAVDRFVAAGIS